MPTIIVKRRGEKERFDERKVYGSVYASCLAEGFEKKRCEEMAADVTKKIKRWVKGRKEISSTHIFREVVKHLKKHDKGAAFLYETHRDVS